MRLDRAWRNVFAELDARVTDLAIIPFDDVPTRFSAQALYSEDFVIVMRAGHPFFTQPTLDHYCTAEHVLVSMTGEAWGFVDRALLAMGRSRRIALTVPNFLFALTCVAESDYLAALPRRLVSAHAQRLGLVQCEPPLTLERYSMNTVVPKLALTDPGVAWLSATLRSLTF